MEEEIFKMRKVIPSVSEKPIKCFEKGYDDSGGGGTDNIIGTKKQLEE